jgi:osmotically-inducible protein OsmY
MTQRTDTQMHKDIVDELAFEPSLDAGKIAVAVQNGIVTLSGSVPSLSQLCAAEQAVKRVRGIRGLAEELSVQPQLESDDTDIAGAARHALAWDATVVDKDVRIMVKHGWITLEGELNWWFERDRAQSLVSHLRGVKGVTNLITLSPHAPPEDLAPSIEAAFRRRTDLEAGQVQVVADAGRVTLRGTVHHWADIDSAGLTAWRAPGVISVDNQLMVG